MTDNLNDFIIGEYIRGNYVRYYDGNDNRNYYLLNHHHANIFKFIFNIKNNNGTIIINNYNHYLTFFNCKKDSYEQYLNKLFNLQNKKIYDQSDSEYRNMLDKLVLTPNIDYSDAHNQYYQNKYDKEIYEYLRNYDIIIFKEHSCKDIFTSSYRCAYIIHIHSKDCSSFNDFFNKFTSLINNSNSNCINNKLMIKYPNNEIIKIKQQPLNTLYVKYIGTKTYNILYNLDILFDPNFYPRLIQDIENRKQYDDQAFKILKSDIQTNNQKFNKSLKNNIIIDTVIYLIIFCFFYYMIVKNHKI